MYHRSTNYPAGTAKAERGRVPLLLLAGVALVVGLGGCAPANRLTPDGAEVPDGLRSLTGARTRVVWLRDVEDRGDMFGWVSRKALIGIDSNDPAGERWLLRKAAHITKPLITPKGDRVVFSDFKAREVRIVNWGGSGLRTLAKGMAIEVWRDPATGTEWVYVLRGSDESEEYQDNPVYRHEIDHPERFELVWNKTPVTALAGGSFQISADGRRAVGLFPWPSVGVADFEKHEWQRVGEGCWTSMAPDNSYRSWTFDGAHRNIFLGAADGRTTARVNLSRFADHGRGEVFHPRWSNHPRFFTLTSPYFLSDGNGTIGGPQVEVLVARFNEAFTKVEALVPVTRNNRGDYFPDVWVDRDPFDEPSAVRIAAATETASPTTRWPGDLAGLVLRWESASQKNEVVDPETGAERVCRLQARGLARIGRYHVMDLVGGGGAFFTDPIDGNALEQLRQGYGFSFEVTLTASTVTSAPAPVVANSTNLADSNFALVQDGDALVLHVKTFEQNATRTDSLTLGQVTPGKPVHVSVSYSPYGEVVACFDGVRTIMSGQIKGTLETWTAQPLVFGGEFEGGPSWSGQIDGFTLYDIGISEARLVTHAELNADRLAGRRPAERIVVQARLEEMTLTPQPAAIAPYRRCLVVHRYQVERVISGRLPGDEILVAHWGILDGVVVAGNRPRVGDTYRLAVESFDDHTQLVSERMDMDTTSFDLPLYYEPQPRRAEGEYSATGEDRVAVGAN